MIGMLPAVCIGFHFIPCKQEGVWDRAPMLCIIDLPVCRKTLYFLTLLEACFGTWMGQERNVYEGALAKKTSLCKKFVMEQKKKI